MVIIIAIDFFLYKYILNRARWVSWLSGKVYRRLFPCCVLCLMRFHRSYRVVYLRKRLKHLLLGREPLAASCPKSFATVSFLLVPMVEICTKQYDSPSKKIMCKKTRIILLNIIVSELIFSDPSIIQLEFNWFLLRFELGIICHNRHIIKYLDNYDSEISIQMNFKKLSFVTV